MKFYVDDEYKCHAINDGAMRVVEDYFFDGKCVEFIEGYKYDDSKGNAVIYPWKPYSSLELAQKAVDRTREQADEQIMELLDVIEELIIGG